MNCFIIFLDAALLATAYSDLFNIQTTFKACVYSVKLRLEFVVLNDLMEIVGGRNASVFSEGAGYPSSNDHTGGDLQLGTMKSRKAQQSGDHYLAHVAPGSGYQDNNGPNLDNLGGVLRTTEVHVQGAPKSGVVDSQVEIHPDAIDGQQYGQALTTVSRRRASSPGSSEIEFAGKGAYPS